MKRKSTASFVAAFWAAFLVAVSVSDRDPSPFTWLLVVVFLFIVGNGVRHRMRGN